MRSTEDFGAWVGRSQEAQEPVTERLRSQFAATFDPHLADCPAGILPLLAHWCLFPDAVAEAQLGADGHPERGGFLPPIRSPRRMWAAGEVTFLKDLRIGDRARRRSMIRSIVHKEGRSGPLWFVEIAHETESARGRAISERQTLVYREGGSAPSASPAIGHDEADKVEQVGTSNVRLFRYSAITFNSHRIHFDAPYAMDVEGYKGLVVHGPLQATLLAHFATKFAGSQPSYLSYRATSPLIAGKPMELRAAKTEDGLACCVCDADGGMTMEAKATWPKSGR
jgi:3-methylfumaryl-CoA hydratase